jgi:hypothetical protein
MASPPEIDRILAAASGLITSLSNTVEVMISFGGPQLSMVRRNRSIVSFMCSVNRNICYTNQNKGNFTHSAFRLSRVLS